VAAIVPRVKFFQTLFPLLALLLLNGCAATPIGRPVYHENYRRITVTDYRGKLVAEWIAEGNVWRRGQGYRFRAVQRISGPPFVTTAHYPLGRRVEISGPHIVIAPCGKPDWLYAIDGF
jgi:hypothetical protein